jgi:hypothetical protein
VADRRQSGEYGTIRPGIDVEVWAEIGGPNLAVNSSFENPTPFAGWTTLAGSMTWAADPDAYHGASSLRGTVTEATFTGIPAAYGTQYQTIVDPGYEGPWVASVWVKAPAGRGIAATMYKYYDVGGVTKAPWDAGYPADATNGGGVQPTVIASGDWQRITATFPADTSSATAAIDFRVGVDAPAPHGSSAT